MIPAIALLCFAGGASAQKDAAERAKEGAIDHWIELLQPLRYGERLVIALRSLSE